MSEIINPQQTTYWIITDGGSYASGETDVGQTTSVGYGWRIYWMGSDHAEYVSQCSNVGIRPRPTNAIPNQTLTARQVRLWLIKNGVSLDSVSEAINNIQDAELRNSVAVEWEYAPYIERDHPMLTPLAEQLGLSESDIDRAFTEAITL